ncbi:MAG: heme exporter protein CcmD [Ilumatobacter sp.]|nr:MAG: heme exporter protein CcmD [Ilumatobacter sp.]
MHSTITDSRPPWPRAVPRERTDVDDAGFIIGSYAITFAAIAIFAWTTIRRGRKLAQQVPPEEQYWT